MKSKTFVLAGLVLLAITGLLALAGCKNDTVSETPAAKLVSISVTPSEGTVYNVGDEVVHKKDGEIGVTAHYDNGRTRTVTGTITTDTSTLTESAGVQTVTVRYSEGGIVVSGQFEIRVLPKKLTNYTSPNHTGSEWTYMEFGEWPQTIKDDSVKVEENKSKQMGMFTYYLGSDENWYVKVTAKPYEDTYTYSDGNPVEEDKVVYFKVEPIVWRVLTEDYKDPEGKSTSNALLLAEKILTGGIPYYVDLNTRTITGAGTKEGDPNTVYPNNWQYSTIRAWLNGLDVVKSDDPLENDTTYTGKGFLQTAFTESAQKLIELTSVDNSAASTIPSGITDEDRDYEWFWNSGENPYASDTPTKDKIFLLSEQEATNSDYGFDEYDRWVGDDYGTTTSTRIRDTTDYAEATGAYPGDSSAGYGGWWWLRSPLCLNEYYARDIDFDGYANGRNDRDFVGYAYVGVVPALSISLKSN